MVDGTSCADGTVCNGDESCQLGVCTSGTALNCDDGNVCTEDSCDAVLGCQNVNNDANSCDDANACTVDTCTAGVCDSVCPTGVSAYPYAEDFDGGFGVWSNVGGDVFEWPRQTGTTLTSNTGPAGAHTTGSGSALAT